MSEREPYFTTAVTSFLSGVLAAVPVAGTWLLATGEPPSLLVTIVVSQAVAYTWSTGQAIRFQRKWQQVLAAYERPALGEGIDIPNRPPADDGGAS
jgi:hypothetical protein